MPAAHEREPGHAVAAHHLCRGGQVGRAAHERAAQQPDEVRRALDPPHAGRQRAGVAGRDEGVGARPRTGGAAPDVGERVRVRVEQLDHVVAAARVRHVDDERARREIESSDRVGRVDVGEHDRSDRRVDELADAQDLVLREALHGLAHRHRGQPIDVGGHGGGEDPALGARVAEGPLRAREGLCVEGVQRLVAAAEGARRKARALRLRGRHGSGCERGEHGEKGCETAHPASQPSLRVQAWDGASGALSARVPRPRSPVGKR